MFSLLLLAAAAVNLAFGCTDVPLTLSLPHHPQDVYTEISSLVKRRVAADAAAGVPEAQAIVKYTQGALLV